MDTMTDLKPYIIANVPGAPENMVRLQIIQAFREFCMDTEVWTEKVVMDAVKDQSDYNITLTNDASIQRILYVKAKTSASQSFDDLWAIDVSRYYLNDDGNTVSFYNNKELSTSVTSGVEFKFALRPLDTTTSLSGDLIDRYGDGIISLATYKLMVTPGTPYFNPDLAQFHYNQYRNTRSVALREKQIKKKNQGMTVTQLGGIL
jgi:hypothetical protein